MPETLAEVLTVIKPLCGSLMDKPESLTAIQIQKLLESLPDPVVVIFSEPILYPITHHLKKSNLSKDTVLKLLELARSVIQRIRIDKYSMFFEIYYCVRNQICEKDNGVELIKEHEELKECVALCLKDLIKNSFTNVIEEFYTRQYAALISHGIFICLTIAKQEKSISLRCAALEAMSYLLQVYDEADANDVVLRQQIADVVMLFLPGVAMGLSEVAVKSDVQNHKVTVLSVKLWFRTVALVMQDVPENNEIFLNKTDNPVNDIFMKSEKPKNLEKIKEILNSAKRTPEWYKTASEKLKIVISELDFLTKYSHFKVRLELITGIKLLLMTCSKNMQLCFMDLLEMLITLSEDLNEEISNNAKASFKVIEEKCDVDSNMKSIVEILEENIYDLLVKLPRIVRTSTDALQLVWLNRLSGYIKILGKQRFSRILLSPAHLKKLLLSLVYISEMDCSGITLLQDLSRKDLDDKMYFDKASSWKQYKFLFDSSCINKLNSIFELIGQLGDCNILIDSILKMMTDLPKFKKEFTLILNYILKDLQDEANEVLYRQVIEEYIAPDNWDLEIRTSDTVSLQEAQSNVIQCCLYLEGIGNLGAILKENHEFLLKTLYLVIERAGSDNNLLRRVGLKTLKVIAKSQNLDNIGDLLKVNVDYISYHITLKLRRVERNPGVLDVIEVVTNYSTIDFLHHLKSVVEDLLVQSGSHIQKCNTLAFIKALYTFIICVKRITAGLDDCPKSENNEKTETDLLKSSTKYVIKNIIEYRIAQENVKLLRQDDQDLNEMESINTESGADEYDDDNVRPPYYINMTVDIMKRCLHFLPSQDFNESSMAMSTLKEGAVILKKWENDLLPIVHLIWHPLVDRFKCANPLVVNHAWELLCCLVDVSHDFIRARTLKQIFPSLSKFLKDSSIKSFKKNLTSTYVFTQVFKVQKKILMQLGNFVKQLQLHEKDVWDVLDFTEVYLDGTQMSILQECCVKMYKEISDYNPDVVLIKSIGIWNKKVENVSPQDDVNIWYLKVSTCSINSSYKDNLENILKYILF